MQYEVTGSKGTVQVEARTVKEAKHKAMVEFWGPPNGRPADDTDSDGKYLGAGLNVKPNYDEQPTSKA